MRWWIGKKVVSLNSYVGLLIWNSSGPNIAVMELSIRTFWPFSLSLSTYLKKTGLWWANLNLNGGYKIIIPSRHSNFKTALIILRSRPNYSILVAWFLSPSWWFKATCSSLKHHLGPPFFVAVRDLVCLPNWWIVWNNLDEELLLL